MLRRPMPAVFFGHGTPMNALDNNRYTEAWRAFGEETPRPQAILVISAHWFMNATAVTAMSRPKTIHDFYGFPQELSAIQYPAPGDPGLAEEIAEIVKPTWVGLDNDSWGLDHGTWSVLVHAFPDADIPVVQLSINALKPFDYHFELGAKLAPFRDRGVLVVGSGNVVHNLRAIDWERPHNGFSWAERFGEDARAVMLSAPSDLARLIELRDFRLAAPTPDHFLPLAYIAGVASVAGQPADVLVDGYTMGSLSMASYTIGAHVPVDSQDQDEAPVLPKVPADETNL